MRSKRKNGEQTFKEKMHYDKQRVESKEAKQRKEYREYKKEVV